MFYEQNNGEYTISSDQTKLDIDVIYNFISKESYWGIGRPIEVVRKSIQNSLSFGVYLQDKMVGFARVVTDYATFAWIADVFILPEYRGRGLSKWLMKVIVTHPQLQGLRRMVLATRDAHELYRQYGFVELNHPKT
jgi:GNAT superfamily N-acetyltransferase